MKVLCQETATGICAQCGSRLRLGFRRTCPRWAKHNPPPKAVTTSNDCPHLLDPTGDTVRVFGCGCASSRANGIEVSVFACDLHGRCVIFPRGTHLADAAIRRCAECPDHPTRINRSTSQHKTNTNHHI